MHSNQVITYGQFGSTYGVLIHWLAAGSIFIYLRFISDKFVWQT